MVIVFEGQHDQYSMDGTLVKILDKAKKIVKKDWDMVFVVDGKEGAGKSVFAQQVAYYLDPTLNLTRVVFSPFEFQDAVYKAKKFQAIVYDEAYGGLSSKGTMSKVNKMLVKMFTEIRSRNLFIFIVLPSIFLLDKTPAIWRSRVLFRVYDRKFQRGFFEFYNSDRKKELYLSILSTRNSKIF